MVAQYHITGTSSRAIVESAERGIRAGALAPGDRLPTVRGLAERLQVSPSTVAAAYRRLGDRGLVIAKGHAGTTVAPRPPVPFTSAAGAAPTGTRDLRTGLPDGRLLPPLAPVLARLRDNEELPNRYSPRSDPHLSRLAAEQFRADGVPADRITILGGALDGIERALEAQLALGDRVAVEDPGYPPVADLLRAHGLRPVPFGVDDDGPLPDELAVALEHGTRGVILTPRAQNPTGAAITPARAERIRELLDGREILIIEDDHAGPIAGAQYVPVAHLVAEHWVLVRSVTKSLSPDLRVSIVAGDPATIDRIEGRHALGSGWISTILQRCVASLWSDHATAKLLKWAEESYRQRRASLLDALSRRGMRASGSTGLNVWVPVPRESSTVEALLAAGWATAPGDRFRFRSGPAVRVTVSGLDPDDVEPLADAFVAAAGASEPAY